MRDGYVAQTLVEAVEIVQGVLGEAHFQEDCPARKRAVLTRNVRVKHLSKCILIGVDRHVTQFLCDFQLEIGLSIEDLEGLDYREHDFNQVKERKLLHGKLKLSFCWTDFWPEIVLEQLAVRLYTAQNFLCVFGHSLTQNPSSRELHKVLGSQKHFIFYVFLFGLRFNELLRNSAQFEDMRDVVKQEHFAELVFVEHFRAAKWKEHLFVAVHNV